MQRILLAPWLRALDKQTAAGEIFLNIPGHQDAGGHAGTIVVVKLKGPRSFGVRPGGHGIGDGHDAEFVAAENFRVKFLRIFSRIGEEMLGIDLLDFFTGEERLPGG